MGEGRGRGGRVVNAVLHSSGSARTVAVWSVLRAELARRAGDGPLRILDAGGGSGGFAVPLAALGHRVLVVDPSPDSLAALERRAVDAGVSDRILAVQGDIAGLGDIAGDGLPMVAEYDLVLAHSVLEVVDDPEAAVLAVARVVRPGGAASVLAANRHAAVLGRALLGHFDEARRALDDPDGRWGEGDAIGRRFTVDELVGLLSGAGLAVESTHGVRVFADLVPGSLVERQPEVLADLELAASARPAFRDVATQLHLLARRR